MTTFLVWVFVFLSFFSFFLCFRALTHPLRYLLLPRLKTLDVSNADISSLPASMCNDTSGLASKPITHCYLPQTLTFAQNLCDLGQSCIDTISDICVMRAPMCMGVTVNASDSGATTDSLEISTFDADVDAGAIAGSLVAVVVVVVMIFMYMLRC